MNPEDRFRHALEDLLARIRAEDTTLSPSASADQAGAGGNGAPDDLLLRTFGGFQILEQVGRGGMGVVYKAVQLDPGRPVALKVLAPRLRTDPTARARFRHEVRVAARLHHTHLVPVFAATHGADGPDAYAMPFICGLSLAAVVRGLRCGFPEALPHPGFARVADLYRTDPRAYAREIAGWVRQAAEALDAAHRAGVVHRDVKPGNLLLEFTPAGRPHVWVHDFGLAYQEGEEDGWASAGGFGTRGYASPEMTAGDPAHRHPRTDVYALGVTLYELLTLRRPRPEELTGVRVGGVPRELIRVVKAATSGGYATAGELATDLDRYLTDRPVRAGRPGWVRHATRWAARHRTPLGAAAAAFAVAAAVGAGLLVRAYDREHAARLAAERREELALTAVEMYSPVVDDLLYATPGMLDRQRKLLERARAVHVELCAARPNDPKAAERLAQVEWRLGRVFTRLGRGADGAAALDRSIDLFRAVAAADPGEPLHRLDLARSHAVISTTRHQTGCPERAVADYAAAVEVVRGLVADYPADVRFRDALASYLGDYGAALMSAGRAAEADGALREALATAEASRAAAAHWHGANPVLHAQRNLASHSWATCRPDDALRYSAAALKTCRFLIERAEDSTEASRALDLRGYRQVEIGLVHDRLVWLLALGRDAGLVASDYERIAKRFMDHYPDHPHDYTTTLALYRGWVAYRAGRSNEQFTRFNRHKDSLEIRLAMEPTSAAAKAAVARFAATCPADGVCDLERAEKLAREAVAVDPCPRHLFALGAVLARQGSAEAAAVLARVPDGHPDRRAADLFLAVAAVEAGSADEAQLWLTRAASRRHPPDPVEPDLLYRLATRGVSTAAR